MIKWALSQACKDSSTAIYVKTLQKVGIEGSYLNIWWWEGLMLRKISWCWERLKAGGERDDRRWDDWMASQTQWTWVWINSRSWWWTGRPGMLLFRGSQRVGHNWMTELNWPQHNEGRILQTNSKHYFQWWKTAESISSKIRNKTRVPILTTIIQHSFGSPSHSNQRRKRNKKNPDEKEQVTLSIWRWHDTIYRKP